MSKPKQIPSQSREKGLREKRGMWEIRFQINGRPISQVTEFEATEPNRPLAIAQMVAMKENMRRGTIPDRIVPTAFDLATKQFLDFYKGETSADSTHRRTSTSFVSLIRRFNVRPLSSIGAADVEDYKQWRREEGMANATIHNDLCNLSLLFQYGMKRNWCSKNPVEEVTLPSVKDSNRIFVVSPDLEQRYFEAAARRSMYLADIGKIEVTQGCRPEEVMVLQQSHIDLDNGWFFIAKGKSQAAKRRLLMTREAFEIFKRRLEIPNRWVFPSPRVPAQPIANIYNAHNEVLELIDAAALQEQFVPYSLRHTFATRFAVAGCALPTLARILGHGNLSSVQKYVHPSQQAQDDAMTLYSKTGVPPPQPSLPMGAKCFEDICSPLGQDQTFDRANSSLLRARFEPISPSKKGKIYVFGDKSNRKGA